MDYTAVQSPSLRTLHYFLILLFLFFFGGGGGGQGF